MFEQFFPIRIYSRTFFIAMAFIAMATISSGCTLVPGTNVSTNVFELPSNLGANKPAVEASVIKITPSVVANLEVAALDLSPKWESSNDTPYDYKIGAGDVLVG